MWDSASWICTTRPNNYQRILFRGYASPPCDAVRCKRLDLCTAQTWQLHHDNVPVHSSHLIQTFLAKMTLLSYTSLLTLLTWPPVIFGYLLSRKCCWKGPDLSQEKTQYKIWQDSCTPYLKMASRHVSKSGRTTGRSVCNLNGSTLKGINV